MTDLPIPLFDPAAIAADIEQAAAIDNDKLRERKLARLNALTNLHIATALATLVGMLSEAGEASGILTPEREVGPDGEPMGDPERDAGEPPVDLDIEPGVDVQLEDGTIGAVTATGTSEGQDWLIARWEDDVDRGKVWASYVTVYGPTPPDMEVDEESSTALPDADDLEEDFAGEDTAAAQLADLERCPATDAVLNEESVEVGTTRCERPVGHKGKHRSVAPDGEHEVEGRGMMPTENRAQRRKAAKAAGVKGQLVAGLVVVPKPVTSVTLAGAVVGAIEGLAKRGGDPYSRAVITIGSDHPEHPGELVVEAKTDRMAQRRLGARSLEEGHDGDA